MGTSEVVVPFFLILFLLFPNRATSEENCSNSLCSKDGPVIRFPFRLEGRQHERCGFPGFTFSCNSRSETVLELPNWGEFLVRDIDYVAQEVHIYDPDNCIPRRLLNLNLFGSPFKGVYYQNYTFLNCSSGVTPTRTKPIIDCLSSSTRTVLAVPSMSFARLVIPRCEIIATISVPVPWLLSYGYSFDLNYDLRLMWDEPDCGGCISRGGKCRFKSNTSSEIGCFDVPRRGLPRGVRYAITVGVGIPALMCTIGIACYVCARVKAYGDGDRRHHFHAESSSVVSPQPTIVVVGLDGPTIESYPKMVLGESRRLPKPNDNTCPICLSEYRPKETLRSIPDCKHCFHADCIDEWLRMNATCPLCRNSPTEVPPPPVHATS